MSSAEVEAVRADVILPPAPASGEVIDLADRPRVANAIAELEDWQRSILAPLIRHLKEALIEEGNARGEWTLRYGRTEVTMNSPQTFSYSWDDPGAMRAELLAAGLPADRVDEVVSVKTTYSVNRAEAMKVGKAKAEYARIVEKHMTKEPKPQSASVKRKGA